MLPASASGVIVAFLAPGIAGSAAGFDVPVDTAIALRSAIENPNGNDRDDGLRDIGALEYHADFACDTRVAGGEEPSLPADGFESP